jgi:hypothetical protein
VAGNLPITLVILVLVGLWVYRSRSSIRLAMYEDRAPWNHVGKVATYSTVLFVVWVTVLDNWRQMLGYVVITGRDYATDPFETAATPEAIRWVSLALLAVSVISVAAMYARHRGSYVFLILAVIFAPVFMFTFNELRISADAFMRLSEVALQNPQLVDAGFILFWSTGMFVITAGVVLAAYLTLLAIVAIPMRIIYGAINGPKQENLAQIFESYERRARQSREPRERESPESGLNNEEPASP